MMIMTVTMIVMVMKYDDDSDDYCDDYDNGGEDANA